MSSESALLIPLDASPAAPTRARRPRVGGRTLAAMGLVAAGLVLLAGDDSRSEPEVDAAGSAAEPSVAARPATRGPRALTSRSTRSRQRHRGSQRETQLRRTRRRRQQRPVARTVTAAPTAVPTPTATAPTPAPQPPEPQREGAEFTEEFF